MEGLVILRISQNRASKALWSKLCELKKKRENQKYKFIIGIQSTKLAKNPEEVKTYIYTGGDVEINIIQSYLQNLIDCSPPGAHTINIIIIDLTEEKHPILYCKNVKELVILNQILKYIQP